MNRLTRAAATCKCSGMHVGILEGALIHASGRSGGGKVLVGGDYQGSNTSVLNAKRTLVHRGTTITADAIVQGNAGTVIVWADEWAQFGGEIFARGGADGGDGGFVEVSGKQFLNYQGYVDLSAVDGDAGTLLLDPTDLVVDASGGADDALVSGDGRSSL